MTVGRSIGRLGRLLAVCVAMESSALALAAPVDTAEGKPPTQKPSAPIAPNAPGNQRSAPSGAGGESGIQDREVSDVPAPEGNVPLVGSDLEILKKLHEDNRMEIAMGRAASERGSSPAIKAFGRKLAADHTAADKKIEGYLKAKKLDDSVFTAVKGERPADHDLGQHTGQDFDRAFCQVMIDGHLDAIDRAKKVRDATTDRRLKTLLNSLLPVLEGHLKTARSLARKIAAPS